MNEYLTSSSCVRGAIHECRWLLKNRSLIHLPHGVWEGGQYMYVFVCTCIKKPEINVVYRLLTFWDRISHLQFCPDCHGILQCLNSHTGATDVATVTSFTWVMRFQTQGLLFVWQAPH